PRRLLERGQPCPRVASASGGPRGQACPRSFGSDFAGQHGKSCALPAVGKRRAFGPVQRPSDRKGVLSISALLVFSALFLFGCDSRTSSPLSQQVESAPVPTKTELVPLTNMVAIKAGTFMRI